MCADRSGIAAKDLRLPFAYLEQSETLGIHMDVHELLIKNRSHRRFHEDEHVSEQTLVELVELTRYCPSGANRQPLRYLIAHTPEHCAEIFPHLGWAKWLPDWDGPEPGDRPAGYITILGDRTISGHFDHDAAIAAFAILLGATERGLGGCMIGWIHRDELAQTLDLPENLQILMVIALGRPKDEVVLEESLHPSDIAYWCDAEGRHHVPKRPLDELILPRSEPVLSGADKSPFAESEPGGNVPRPHAWERVFAALVHPGGDPSRN